MAQSTFTHARISGISAVVPKHEICIEDELQYFGGSLKKAQRLTAMAGIHKRRVAEAGVTASDLCRQAAENLFRGMNADVSDIGAIIFLSQGPDHFLPATACILQHKLGLPKACAAFDVNQGCAGFPYGLWLASSLVESGALKKVLLLVGEGLSRVNDRDNRVVASLFGDCGTAALVEYSPEISRSWYEIGTDGGGAEALMIPAGHARLPLPNSPEEFAPYCERITDSNGTPWRLHRTYMDGGAVFDFTVTVVPPHIHSLMAYSGKSEGDIDKLILHQSNRQIMQAVSQKAGFPENKTPMGTFSKYGNQAGASIPATLCDELAEQIRSKPTSLLLCGYGVGLSWASAIMEIGPVWCSGIVDYVTPNDHCLPEEYIAYWNRKIRGGNPDAGEM